MLIALAAVSVLTCTPIVTDGDTFRCGDERIRLLGIDAPELGRCQTGRRCAPGNPQASKAHLGRRLAAKSLRIARIGKDRYGRTLAIVSAEVRDLSCLQLEGHFAIYVPKWDNGQRVAALCPRVAKAPN